MNIPSQNITSLDIKTQFIKNLSIDTKINSIAVNKPISIAIGSGKGGVGKTLTAVNLAYKFNLANKKVTIIDANFCSPSLHTFFGISNPKNTLKDLILHPNINLNQLTHNTNIKNINVICGSPSTLGVNENSYAIALKLNQLYQQLESDVIIYDLGASNLSDIALFLQADEGIIVTSPEPPAIQECFNFFKLCLFKKLEQLLQGEEDLLATVDAAYDDFNSKTSEKIKSIISSLYRSEHCQLNSNLAQFHPSFLLNMVHTEAERSYALAFQVAIKEIFGVQIQFWGTINHYSQFRGSNVNNFIDNNTFNIEKEGREPEQKLHQLKSPTD